SVRCLSHGLSLKKPLQIEYSSFTVRLNPWLSAFDIAGHPQGDAPTLCQNIGIVFRIARDLAIVLEQRQTTLKTPEHLAYSQTLQQR
ncbi:MAG: hypothetical protein AAFY67_16565, partial [Cyanobacteria bacterium J06642_9]